MRKLVAAGTIFCTIFCTMSVGLALAPRSVGASSAPGAATQTSPVQSIVWGPCSDPALIAATAQCGMLGVPLDYDHPRRTQIQLAVSRVKHTASETKYQGVMLTNPGGPGASGLQLATLGAFVPGAAGAEYDWIGFDPRGVGSSKPALSCVPDYFVGPRPPYVPTTRAILDTWRARSRAYAKACKRNAPELLAHMKTTDSARDMDSIRAALGAEKISYYGFSYGTYLGEVYATLFPGRVHRMVLDSSVDPRRVWYHADLDHAPGIERNIKIWFGWLAKYDAVYHLGTTEVGVEQLFYRQVSALGQRPAAGGIGPDEFEDAFYGAAYGQSFWTFFGAIFSSWVHDHNPAGVTAAYKAFDTPGDDNAFAVNNAVVCTDAHWPDKWRRWAHDFRRTYGNARFATWNIAWYAAPCRTWPVAAGKPVRVKGGRVSALLVDETLDAATPYEGSLEVRSRFPNARLLAEPGGTTHAGTLFGNACVDGRIADYLATGALPARLHGRRADATCAPLPQPVPENSAGDVKAEALSGARAMLTRPTIVGRLTGS